MVDTVSTLLLVALVVLGIDYLCVCVGRYCVL